jgi:hypothetical protein
MKGEKWLFSCLVVIGCLVLLTINGYAQKTIVEEDFGTIKDESGNSTKISVEDGKRFYLWSTDNHSIERVLMGFAHEDANELLRIVEEAYADLVKPSVKIAKNQTINKEFGTIQLGNVIIVKVRRASYGTYLEVSNYDSSMINKVHLNLYRGQAKKYLEALRKAVKSMK